VRRGFLLVGVWLLGAVFAVAFSFAAVRRVASGVTRSSGVSVSHAVDPETTTVARSQAPSTPPAPRHRASVHSNPALRPTVPAPVPGPSATGPLPAYVAPVPNIMPATTTPAIVSVTTPPSPGTAIASQGGTVWTRCSGANTIVYIAAVPKSGYQRITDVEDGSGIEQQFDNGAHRSTVQASCSHGVVHAQVEEETTDD
jgi:hypothetical protein